MTKREFVPVTFELSDDERMLLVEALGDHAMRYKGHLGRVDERCWELVGKLEAHPVDDDEPITERRPTTISTVPPPSSTPPLFIGGTL